MSSPAEPAGVEKCPGEEVGRAIAAPPPPPPLTVKELCNSHYSKSTTEALRKTHLAEGVVQIYSGVNPMPFSRACTLASVCRIAALNPCSHQSVQEPGHVLCTAHGGGEKATSAQPTSPK